ncbi:IS110 family transposase [uncultured Legionella sp.]|uniref:IS110 family transposase n=1 Tax=uncultured Legionella sp. TaxID=210934 RepID=UPI0026032C40|nr:IS110 family transposase [uncultured Legionella sp.]
MKNTNTPRQIVGVDVSKDKLDIYESQTGQWCTVENDEKSIRSFLKKLKKNNEELLIVMENTGGLEKNLLYVSQEQGISTHLAHSNRVHYFAKQKGYFAKTDKKDAQIIAEYAKQEQVEANVEHIKEQNELRELINRRAQIVDDLHDEKCRLSRPLSPPVKRSIKRKITFLEAEKKLIEAAIEQLIKACPIKDELFKRLQTFKGIGPAIGAGLVCLVPELGKMNRSHIASILGVAPKNNDSGKKVGKRKIVGGRFNARRLVYMGALVAIRYNIKLKEMYQRMMEKGKPAKVAIVAVMRKIIITLNAMVRDQKNWNSDFETSS